MEATGYGTRNGKRRLPPKFGNGAVVGRRVEGAEMDAFLSTLFDGRFHPNRSRGSGGISVSGSKRHKKQQQQ